jgi:Head domain of trimeric autotransporter adhesin
MKKIYSLFGVLFFAINVFAQNVGIGTATPNASAVLELQSTNKGLLLPRVADTNAVPSPAKGLLIFTNATNSTWFYDGAKWQAAATDGLWTKYQDSITTSTKKYVGINTDYSTYSPKKGIQASGSLLIHPEMSYTNAAPTVAQTYTMNNSSGTVTYSDSIVRIFDPGGQGNPYINNTQGNIFLNATGSRVGYLVSFNPSDFGLAVGDTLWISKVDFPACRTNFIKRYTNTTIVPVNFTIASLSTFFNFRSNSDNLNAAGFDITCKAIYAKANNESINEAIGTAMLFNGSNGSFSAGLFALASGNTSIAMGENSTAKGAGSTAIGLNTTANGFASIAMGNYTNASGNYSTALGLSTDAIGQYSTALGSNTTATGSASTAMGDFTTASGVASTAMGSSTIASGDGATSMGNYTKALGSVSTAMGNATIASGFNSTSIGSATSARSYASVAIGSLNDSIVSSNPNVWVNTDPLFYIGNSNVFTTRSNAMVVYKNANVDINGFTRLGKASESAPIIKMKEIIGVGPNGDNATIAIVHGLTASKIISVTVLSEYGAGSNDLLPPNYKTGNITGNGYEYTFQVRANDIFLSNVNGNSAGLTNRAVKILITYKE